jgi:hypothetical protein
MTDFVKQFRAATDVSTPLVAVRTFDNASASKTILDSQTDDKKAVSVISWDCIKGFTPVTDSGSATLKKAIAKAESDLLQTGQINEALRVLNVAVEVMEDTFVLLHNPHLFWSNDPAVIQGIWNLRDKFKPNGNMLVLLVSSGAILPPEISNDILVLDEVLPDVEDLEVIVSDVFEYAKFPPPDKTTLGKATAALVGLPTFTAEQSVAMSLDVKNKCLNIDNLWERKRQTINQTRGLSVYTGSDEFDDVGGLTNVKNFLTRIMEGNDPPQAIIFLDEIEKSFAGSGTDSSGVKTELNGAYLSWSEDNHVMGILCVGLPGVGKSQLPKTLGRKYGIPFIKFDIAAMQDPLVGNSGTYVRNAFAIVNAVSNGHVLAIATCNGMDSLSPELQSRFQLATFFYDAPTEEERSSIWNIYKKSYKLDGPLPVSEGWTGREIKGCCEKAYRLNIPILEAAKYVVPCTVSNAGRVEHLRRSSSGKYLSASHEGLYTYDPSDEAIPVVSGTSGRRMKG